MKKVLLIIMCIISFALASCSNNTSSENKISSKNNNQIVSEKKTDTVTETSTEPSKDTEKKIKKFYVNYSGFKMDVDFDEDDIADLLDEEKNATVPSVEMKMSFADLIVVYTDGTEGIFGTIYIGADDCYYLQFANSKVEGAAFKMPDSSFSNELF
ncbi:hypothetical protein [Eubacterium coprostanoligenes]|uniref:hypothetical protein n=1 Tax=Eubacterium coprostanoligenes TaxID=290054 RepID=UPI002351F950|nr:hypothetical protein [Eubacterium coprostanoligenes]MCI6254063.1 hypothetical protein [Eubacterium coprostanoligenes]MDY5399814.1 hypothetical protein [Eubacterium coprostanoligenes]